VKTVEYEKGNKCQTLPMKVLDSCAVWCCAVHYLENQQKEGRNPEGLVKNCGNKRNAKNNS
jgi:hypothetical protein